MILRKDYLSLMTFTEYFHRGYLLSGCNIEYGNNLLIFAVHDGNAARFWEDPHKSSWLKLIKFENFRHDYSIFWRFWCREFACTLACFLYYPRLNSHIYFQISFREYELALRINDGDDPLDVWYK